MLQEFKDFIRDNGLSHAGDRILVAVSGGVDSVVLAHLYHLSGGDFGIAHCNFRLRGAASDGDELFVRDLAGKYNCRFHLAAFETLEKAERDRISTQMAARELRYEWFAGLMQNHGYDYLATAHHLSDTVETILFNLAKGTGVRGLRGIKKKTEHIIRPLMFAEKNDILLYARENGLKWREDASNASDKYSRNRLRHRVIPELLTLNPSLEKNIVYTIDRLSLAERALDEMIDRYREKHVEVADDHIRILLEPIDDYTLLHEILKPYGFTLRQAKMILHSDSISGNRFLSEKYLLVRDRESLILTEKEAFNSEIVVVDEDSREVTSGNHVFTVSVHQHKAAISREQNVAMLDYERLSFPLEIRNWQEGEKFRPLGMKGKKKISDFMIDHKIPLNLKKNYQVLVSAGEIVWLIGLRIDDRFKIKANTNKIYQIEIDKTHV